MAGLEFLRRAHIEQIEGARAGFGLPLLHRRLVGEGHIEAPGDRRRPVLRDRHGVRRRLGAEAGGAVLAGETGQFPAHGAVLQGRDLVGNAGVDQALGADDAARAAGAVDDDQRFRVGRDLVDPVDQFGTGHVDAARNVHAPVFLDGPAVQDHHVPARPNGLVQCLGRQAGRVVGVLDEFAERLGRHVDAGIELVAGFGPRRRPAFEDADIAVAEGVQHLHRFAGDAGRAVVAKHDPHASARHEVQDLQFEAR